MTLLNLLIKYMPDDFNPTKHRYVMLLVELANGERRWFRASPKLTKAIKLHQKMNNGNLPLDTLIGSYINIPLMPYFGRNHGIIGVGKIIYLKYQKVPVSTLCTRSQFVTADSLKQNWHKCYHYLRHDYNWYSKINIYVDLQQFRQKLIKK